MKAMICGYEHKEGIFKPDAKTEIAYNNITLFCLYKRVGIVGDAATSIKFKMDQWIDALKSAGLENIEPIGLRIDLDYDNQGRFCGVGLPGSEFTFDIELLE